MGACLQTSFRKRYGTALRVAACCIDSGYRSNQVYSFTVDKFDRHVFAIKGKGGQGVPYIRNPSKDNRVKTPLFTIGVDAGKDFIYQRLRVVVKGSVTRARNSGSIPRPSSAMAMVSQPSWSSSRVMDMCSAPAATEFFATSSRWRDSSFIPF